MKNVCKKRFTKITKYVTVCQSLGTTKTPYFIKVFK